jgi:hypothetical protein
MTVMKRSLHGGLRPVSHDMIVMRMSHLDELLRRPVIQEDMITTAILTVQGGDQLPDLPDMTAMTMNRRDDRHLIPRPLVEAAATEDTTAMMTSPQGDLKKAARIKTGSRTQEGDLMAPAVRQGASAIAATTQGPEIENAREAETGKEEGKRSRGIAKMMSDAK